MNNKINSSYKVIADHLRSSAFLVADGVLPSNEGRGYVLRRIMRRAMLHCNKLNPSQAFFYKLVPDLINEMSGHYPDLKNAKSLITDTLKIEEERFRKTLDKGIEILEEEISKISGNIFSGKAAFKLYDTYGFPLDLTQNILKEKNIEVDIKEFDQEMEKQKIMARKNWSGSGSAADNSIYFDLREKLGATKPLFYEKEESQAKIIAIIKDGKEVQNVKAGDENVEIILGETPFYATSGGQRGDEGVIKIDENNSAQIKEVIKKADGLFVHLVSEIKGELSSQEAVKAQTIKRGGKKRAHSATHLLHYVLRKNFGDQLTQKGSDVANDSFTFDFNHNEKISESDLENIEDEVNALIAKESGVNVETMKLDEAKKKGAVALFGEKYGDVVRVLSMAEGKSVEFCGGTHVENLGDIKLFKIASEKSVAAGIRRITAQTEDLALNEMLKKLQNLNAQKVTFLGKLNEKNEEENISIQGTGNVEQIQFFRKKKQDLEDKIEDLQEKVKKANKEAEKKKKEQLTSCADFTNEKIGEINLIHHYFEDVNAKDLRDVITVEKSKKENSDNSVICFFGSCEGKVAVALAVSEDLNKNGVIAGKLIPQIVEKVGGKGGGGKPDLAFGGGNDKNGIDDGIEVLKGLLNN